MAKEFAGDEANAARIVRELYKIAETISEQYPHALNMIAWSLLMNGVIRQAEIHRRLGEPIAEYWINKIAGVLAQKH